MSPHDRTAGDGTGHGTGGDDQIGTQADDLHRHTAETDDQMLMALADGELSGPDAEALRMRIATDAALAERFALFTATAAAMREAWPAEAVPDRLIRTVLETPIDLPEENKVIALGPRRAGRPGPGGVGRGRFSAAVLPSALAASLVLGVALGAMMSGSGGNVAGPDAALSATRATASTATGTEIALAEGGTARVLASYQTDMGLCRALAVAPGDGPALQVIACRDGQDWQVALSARAPAEGAGFATASDLTAIVTEAWLDEAGAGAALSPDDEARALTR